MIVKVEFRFGETNKYVRGIFEKIRNVWRGVFFLGMMRYFRVYGGFWGGERDIYYFFFWYWSSCKQFCKLRHFWSIFVDILKKIWSNWIFFFGYFRLICKYFEENFFFRKFYWCFKENMKGLRIFLKNFCI